MPDRRAAALAAVLIALIALAGPLAARPEAISSALAAAAAAAARGEGVAAEAELRKALAAGASRRDVAARMGEAQLLQGDLRNARDWLGPGEFSDADTALGWHMTGRLLRLEGRLADAGQAFDRSLALTPRDPGLWVDIARLRHVGGQHLLAIEASELALKNGPDDPRAIELRAQLLQDSAGPVAALALFEHGLATVPEDLPLLVGYAAALGEAGRATDMLAAVRRIAERNPRSLAPLYFQSVLAARAGQVDLARDLLNRSGNRLADVPAAQMLRAALELEAGNKATAVEALERLDRRQPFNSRVQLLYARALLAVEDHARLRERFLPLVARPEASAYLLNVLARSYERTGEREAAAALLDRAANAGPPPLASHPPRMSAPPGSFAALVAAGDAALLRRNVRDAFASYAQAARVRYPEWLMLRTAFASGDEGIALAHRYQIAFPASLLAPRLAAAGAAQAGNWAMAERLLGDVDRRLGHGDVRVLADLSLAQLRNGDAEAALRSAEQAGDLQRSSAVAALARAMALVQLGRDPDTAASLLDKAERIAGTSPMLNETREQLRR